MPNQSSYDSIWIHPVPSDWDTKDRYSVKIYCVNCHTDSIFLIRKQYRVADSDIICPNCECRIKT